MIRQLILLTIARKKYVKENGDLPKGVMAFGNGGDRTETTTPENDVCNSYGIDSVWGLGRKDSIIILVIRKIFKHSRIKLWI